MNKAVRKAIIAGNWKMNKTPNEAKELLSQITPLVKDADCDVIACVPYVDLQVALDATQGTNVKIGAENCHWEKSGAFTGEISAEMLKAMGIEYVIIGHSERRQYFGETDVTVNKRVRAALDAGLTVILCVGELLSEREQGITAETVSLQTKVALQGVSAEELKRIVIAYEPVWAIGTGLTATADQAEKVCAIIRQVLADLYSADDAQAVTIQYGGSMNDANAAELLSKENVDGGLIGGASLVAEKFAAIVKAASV
ncbi:MAG: triose-phosphate isomerase [Ruminococcus sp.]|nr:triose-phosphate isomerase [Ruminococcus sp.]